jgi:uncharacterized protein (UPF0548 family)
MFLRRRPSDIFIDRFLDASIGLPLTYGPVGLAQQEAPAYDRHEMTIVIGRGLEDFDRARAALRRWAHFDVGWVEVFPRRASTDTGTCVAVLVRHLGFWSLNGARVVYQLEQTDTRFGFAYGTLSNHVEQGEEIFEVGLDAVSRDVTYRLRAVSRPRAALARIGYPIARTLQARFRRDSGRALTARVRRV